MDDTKDFESKSPPLFDLLRIDTICDRFELDLRAGKQPAPEDFLGDVPEAIRPVLLEQLRAIAAESHKGCEKRIECGSRIGRYRIERILGEGGFGRVYLAHDDQLKRPVAIKVPHRKLVDRVEDAEAYLTEARTVANLDHPHIVPVFDVGSTEDCPCYVVSKYIDGTDLAARLKASRLSLHDAVELVATVAAALHHAHKQGLVHRDIKPGNILLDKSGEPFVADFGLALREQDVGKGPRCAGTPAYMSPEQARGEGHRVDGRSDIFSLGVVFYQLLAGRRPFRADSESELAEQITSFEPRPPRQFDDSVPKELDRICLKALSKRASERYSTAKDMADDLRHFLNQQPSPMSAGSSRSITPVVQPPSTLAGSGTSVSPATPPSDSQPLKIVPKGLRSFDEHDADFFMELLPGPRDRDGLPDSIRFWKARVEETDADNTFSVGLIYGPSGCGKSSLVKAGLLPQLSHDVITVYVEATAEETETRLLKNLRKRCLGLPASLGLIETLTALRRGQGVQVGRKVLIVLDQFEQWLHAKREQQKPDLVQALRQCDGERVQCLVMVRDDFWMAATRFLTQLEIDLVQGRNIAAIDLFDLNHARKVLIAFGCAFGRLPEKPAEFSTEQNEFLKQAISGLSQENKIICVRLALFAEMMKGKVWTPASLKEVGGTEGVGVTFLEDTFSSPTANPKHRLHQKPARNVLKALLPESGTDIKGHMRSYPELLAASGYGSRPKDFDDLIRILDSDVRLITPTDPEGHDGIEESTSQAEPGEKYYQLTHDYLVHSLRDWLTRKQKETRRGRAELLLADRAAVWNARPENRQLPSLIQWLQVKCLTARENWTLPQQKVMGKANRYHSLRILAAAVLIGAMLFTGLEIWDQWLKQQNISSANAEQAKLEAREKQTAAWFSHLSDANARIFRGGRGQRFESMKAIRAANQLPLPAGHSRDELRTAAIAAICLPDIGSGPEWDSHAGPGEPTEPAFRRCLRDIRMWASLPGEKYRPRGQAISLDGRFALAALRPYVDGMVLAVPMRLWRRDSPEPRRVFDDPGVYEQASAFRPDSRQLALGHPDGTISVYDTETGKEIRKLKVENGIPFSLAYHPSRPVLAVGTVGGASGTEAYLFDCEQGAILKKLPVPGGVSNIAWRPDGRQLAIAGGDKNIYLFDPNSGQRLTPPWTGHQHGGIQLTFNSTGDRIVSNDWMANLRLWDTTTGREIFNTPEDHWFYNQVQPGLLGPNGDSEKLSSLLIAEGLERREIARTTAVKIEPISFESHADGRLHAYVSQQGLGFLDLATGETVEFVPFDNVQRVFFDSKGRMWTQNATSIYRWPVQFTEGEQVYDIGPPERVSDLPVHDFGFSYDSAVKVLAIPAGNAGTLVMHLDTNRSVWLRPQYDVRFSSQVSPDGRWVASTSKFYDGKGAYIKIWEASTGKLVESLPSQLASWTSGFSPDSRWLAATSSWIGDPVEKRPENFQRLWKLSEDGSWKEDGSIPSLGTVFWDKDVVVEGQFDGTLIMTQISTRKELARFTSPQKGRIIPESLLNSGYLLARGDDEKRTLYAWDLPLIRSQLAEMGLDWKGPPFFSDPDLKQARSPYKVRVNAGQLAK